ncbi:MAG: biopolymer transporter ExbD [Candidatus Sericytochromatia bacterium]|nr:biopolymer transporter ExbD [Candidatus Sericytochromatia bacterium]
MLTRQSRRTRSPRFELIPMIDVMMILTIFLAVMAFLPQVRTSITAQLPEASTAENTPRSVTIELTRSGLLLEEQPQTPDSLVQEVRAALARDPETAFVIAADKSLPYEQVIQLLDRVRGSGAKRIGLATSKP